MASRRPSAMLRGPKSTTFKPPPCTECQRRKQKCSRHWPCSQCQKRKAIEKCNFSRHTSVPKKAHHESQNRKRQPSHDKHTDSLESNPLQDIVCGLEALGYANSHIFASFGASSAQTPKSSLKTDRQYFVDAASCPQLKRILELLPYRPYTGRIPHQDQYLSTSSLKLTMGVDSLVQNFLNKVNFHYYMIYPPLFMEEYMVWWSSLLETRPLELQWTCLLLVICACSMQCADVELTRKLETGLGKSTQELSEQYHNAARELRSVIPVGSGHLLNVQSLLYSCYYYKSEARFFECWHALSAAIREAQEVGCHLEAPARPMPEFKLEMRRRVWCVLVSWDWQISALLSRSMIIDRTDCDVGLPSLTLEGYTPSPLLHVKLQSCLIRQLLNQFGLPKNVATPAEVQTYQAILERWMNGFPLIYDFTNPDKSSDAARPWIALHRHYLHMMAYSMALCPTKTYLAKPMSKNSPPVELKIRSDGVDYSLKLMDTLDGFFNHVYPQDAKYHSVLFSMFDTAASLCSAIIHDQDNSIPKRAKIFEIIEKVLSLLKRFKMASKTSRISYVVLVKVFERIGRPATAMKLPSPL